MSNLSDLLPAGGGQNAEKFTATGTLPSGQAVALKADGTVEAIAGAPESVGSAVVFEAADSPYVTSTFDSNSNKIVVSYRDDGNSNYGTVVVGTVSGTSISFGTPVVFFANTVSGRSVVFDSTNNKIVIGFYYYNGSANIGTAIVGTVSGTSISFGSAVSIAGASKPTYISLAYDANAQRVVASYRDANNSDYGTAVVGTVSGTSISFGSPVIFESANSPHVASTFDSNANKVVIAYQDAGNSSKGTAIVGTVSGTSISFGTAVVFENAAQAEGIKVCFDTSTNKILIAYAKYAFGSVNYHGTAVVGTVSGTSISFGSPVAFHAASTYQIGVAYDPDTNKTVITYKDQDNSNYGALVNGTISGTSVSFSSEFVFNAASTSYTAPVYDSNADKTVIFYQDNGNSGYGTGVVYSLASSNFTDFLGITNEAISNAATGEVAVQGGAITNGSLLPQLASSTFGSESVYENSESAYEAAVYDTANDKVVVAYKNTGDSQKGKVVVGTVSGTSISFGTPVDFEGSDIVTYVKAVYDPDQGKVIITWNSNSTGHHKAIVGTVSGTSISFGSAVTYEASAGINFGIVYDTSNDKVVVTFKDGSNSNYGTAIVGTVTGTSISFGTKAVIKSQNLVVVSSVFDSANNKVLISYMEDLGGGSSDRSGIVVGTVSGTSISFGAHLEFLAGQAYNQSLVHDTSSGKNVLVYRDVTNSSYGTAVVATISGTSVSLGTAAVFNDNNTGASCAMYDPTTNATFVFYKDVNSVGTAKGGIVSGTNISFGSASVFNAANPGGIISAVKDPDQNKVIVTYTDYGNSQYGTAVVGTLSNASPALTIGSTYYVQDDGSLGTTSSSVAAGRAIGSTSLLLKG